MIDEGLEPIPRTWLAISASTTASTWQAIGDVLSTKSEKMVKISTGISQKLRCFVGSRFPRMFPGMFQLMFQRDDLRNRQPAFVPREIMAFLKTSSDSGVTKKFELDKDVMALGRHPDCHVVIEDNSVSRFHAQITFDGKEFSVEDLESRNGTFLNEVRLFRPSVLHDGDVVRVCDFSFDFFDFVAEDGSKDEPKANKRLPGFQIFPDANQAALVGDIVVWDESQSKEDGSTIMSHLDLSNALDSDRTSQIGPEIKLKALMEVTRALSGTISLSKVGPKVLDCLLQMFQNADRGFIILSDSDNKLRPIATKSRSGPADEQMRCSRTVFEHVINTKQAVLSADTSSDSRFESSASIVDIEIHSMMCAPLLNTEGKAMGMIQLDSTRRSIAFRETDLELLVVVAMQAASAIEKAHLLEVELEQGQLKRDLQLANEVQVAILPHHRPDVPNYDFYDFYRSANQVGGDYYDYIKLKGCRIAVIVADVVGHGVAAALLMAKFSAEVRFASAVHDTLSEAVASLNTAMTVLHLERFITMVLCVLDPSTGKLTLVNAGHNLPIIARANGETELQDIAMSGLPIGIMDGVIYPECTFQLNSGECITLYTDGLNEQVNTQGVLYGSDRLRKEIGRYNHKGIESVGKGVVADLRLHSEKVPQADDMCLVCFGPKPVKN